MYIEHIISKDFISKKAKKKKQKKKKAYSPLPLLNHCVAPIHNDKLRITETYWPVAVHWAV